MRVAHIVVDIPTRQLDKPFDYRVPDGIGDLCIGSCVLVTFSGRPAVGYVVGLAETSVHERLSTVEAVLGGPYFDAIAAELAGWISREYLCPLSESVRLFTPPGGVPKAARITRDGELGWELRRPGVGPVDDRWAWLAPESSGFVPRANATMQRAIIDALSTGPLRVAELAADLGSIDGALTTLQKAGVLCVERRRRVRDVSDHVRETPRHEHLSAGQHGALEAIRSAGTPGTPRVVLVDGVTGSGKTEVYLRAIEDVVRDGGSACVLVPEISLTPQTVGRFRARFGDQIAVLHSRLSAGERYDQWDRVSRGEAKIVVGARSALFAPLHDLRLIVIDEEHESSYKQGSAPRYHARDVAEKIAELRGATLVLGSASPSMESRYRCDIGEWTRVVLPERVTGRDLPGVTVVDLAREFASGNRSMFSKTLETELTRVRDAREKAVLFLNRRGFASFLLCRECGFVPMCDSCSTSMTYHESAQRLACHHCGATRAVPSQCPRCASPYLRQFGAGTQRVEAELTAMLGDWPVVRMDADTTKGKGSHERLLAAFEALESGVLLGTQMIAKGLDYPEVTLVGVIAADVTLNVPDFRAGERTYQLLEQVAGRAGRGERAGRVVVQTYWADHPAISAAAAHDPRLFYQQESAIREELGYPPFGRLANVLVRGRDRAQVVAAASAIADSMTTHVPDGWQVLGPSPAPLSRLKGLWRWHLLVKAPREAALPTVVSEALEHCDTPRDVSVVVDVDPVDLL